MVMGYDTYSTTAVNQLYGGLNVTWSIRLQSATYPRNIAHAAFGNV